MQSWQALGTPAEQNTSTVQNEIQRVARQYTGQHPARCEGAPLRRLGPLGGALRPNSHRGRTLAWAALRIDFLIARASCSTPHGRLGAFGECRLAEFGVEHDPLQGSGCWPDVALHDSLGEGFYRAGDAL